MVWVTMKKADELIMTNKDTRHQMTMMTDAMISKSVAVQRDATMSRETTGTQAMDVTLNIVEHKHY